MRVTAPFFLESTANQGQWPLPHVTKTPNSLGLGACSLQIARVWVTLRDARA